VRFDEHRNALGNLVLEIEYVFERAVKVPRPKMRAGNAIDKLCRNSESGAGPAHAALQHVAGAELTRHLSYVDAAALVDGVHPRGGQRLANVRTGAGLNPPAIAQ
jgi:hypothetical protein